MFLRVIEDDELKSVIANDIHRQLPSWFGIEEAIADYSQGVRSTTFYAGYDGGAAVGFTSLKLDNQYTAEVYVIGVLAQYH